MDSPPSRNRAMLHTRPKPETVSEPAFRAEASEMSANSWDKLRRFQGKGRQQQALGVALDGRAAAERALDLSERQFRILVESVTDYAIYMLDANGHVTSWNTGSQRIKGYSADEILGQHVSRFYAEHDRALVFARNRTCRASSN